MIEILVENIGRIKKANIKLKDITIVAGINNTGKSTISKILYSGIKPYSEIGRERVCTEISDEIVEGLSLLSENFKEAQSELIMSIYTELKNKKFSSLLRKISDLYKESSMSEEKEDEKKILHIIEKLTIKDTRILENYLLNDLKEMLDNFNSEEKIKIIKDGQELINYDHPQDEEGEYGTVHTRLSMPLLKRVDIYNIIYISTPYILEKIKFPSNYLTMIEEDFMNDFQRNYFTKGIINLNKKKSELRKIEEEIEKIIQGTLILKSPQEIKYLCSDKEVSLNNTATGIKSLGMLLKLLTNDSIKEDTVLIFDEPEVHLHPEWQVKLAAILIMLVKVLKVKLFINSHSSEFIEAIQVYALKEKISGINTYLAKEVENKIIFEDKTEEFGSVFEELGKGYDILDKVKEEIEV